MAKERFTLIYVNRRREHAMSNESVPWSLQCLTVRLERLKAANELTREMLRRSYEQLAISKDLLKRDVPKVWHPEPANPSSVLAINPSDCDAFVSIAACSDV